MRLVHAAVLLERDSRARSGPDADLACSTPVASSCGFCGLAERTTGRGMPDAKTAGRARDHRRDVAYPCLRGFGRDAFIVADASRDEDTTRS